MRRPNSSFGTTGTGDRTAATHRGRFALVLAVAAILFAGCRQRIARQDASTNDDITDGQVELQHGGRTRSYIVRVPSSIAQQRAAAPLVLVLHGGGGNGSNAESMTGFTSTANHEGFIVAYPNGTARGRLQLLTWNAGHCCGYAMEERVDDVGFLRAVIDDIARRTVVDLRRVYVTGMSNGAMMSHRAGREMSDRIAAIAPVVGGVFSDEALQGRGVSALMINGMLDKSVPFVGGSPGGRFSQSWDGTPVKPAIDQAIFWARANGCNVAAKTVDHGRYVHHTHDCPSATAVERYAVKDNGHAWPGGQRGTRLGDAPSTALDATAVIWEFFKAHPKR